MYELKKKGKVFTSKFIGTGPSSYEKRIYRAAVSQRLSNNGLDQSPKASALFFTICTLPLLMAHSKAKGQAMEIKHFLVFPTIINRKIKYVVHFFIA